MRHHTVLFMARNKAVWVLLLFCLFADGQARGDGIFPVADTPDSSVGYRVIPVTTGQRDRVADHGLPVDSHRSGGRDDGRTGFWVVGIIVNILVLVGFILWAAKEWRRR
ncbi:MAG: hypothetical protein KDI63_02900 [Gammaproteobacteria bacterium]|nr:hypothetical protein [Gammaproteobacteria bacterium]